MVSIKIIGSKGTYVAVPFQINSIDTVPEVNTSEEEQIFNYVASDTDKQEESEVGENTGN